MNSQLIAHAHAYFELTVDRQINGAPRLRVEVNAPPISGIALAYFGHESLARVAEAFHRMPIDVSEPANLSLGYLDPATAASDAPTVNQEHIGITAFPQGRTGKLILEVRLALPHSHDRELQREARTQFLATYGQLADLSRGIRALARGECDRIRFEEWIG